MRQAIGLGIMLWTAPLAAQQAVLGTPTQKLRVAVMDLSGSALKMQSTTTMMPGGQPQGQPQYGAPATRQTTVTIAIPPPAEFARGLTEALTTVLVKTGRFTVLERAAMQSVQQEQQIGASGAVTKETAAQTGALLGAQVLITGDITGFTYEKSGLGGALTNIVKGLSVAAERVTAEVIIDLRIIDASTGEVLMSHKGVGKASQTGLAADLTKEEKNYSGSAALTTPLGQASRQALQNGVAGILLGMPKVTWGGRVVDVREGVVYLNSGAEQGMRVGMQLDVYEVQPALVDPETGRNLGAPDKLIGNLVVTSVLEKFSTARIAGGEGFSRGNIVRMKAGNPPPP
ncbi:MAG TPA: CsgG/HfaB family protein [Gemmatimonadales bacterium]|nr:CsgG/HfaB family protein [Gemmatimonadales bacterium]